MIKNTIFKKGMQRLLVIMWTAAANLSMGQTPKAPDADSLGDIWVITIDNTFSMRSRYGIPQDMIVAGEGVRLRLDQSPVMKNANWSKDRFLILKSGLKEGYEVKNGRVRCGHIKYIDSEFIKHTDGLFHRYANQSEFAKTIGEYVAYSDYNNYGSFVSQMRLLSLHKILDYLTANDEQMNYRDIKIMTISDDAVDQYDQWNMDYRALKECAPEKVEYLSGLARRYINNPLNGWGAGDMLLEWKDETQLPNIWSYQYITAEGKRLWDNTGKYVTVTARNGHSVQIQIKPNENGLCLCRIDSMVVNGKTLNVGQYLTDTLWVEEEYNNGFFANKLTIYGKAQIEYEDSILGPHYRMVDFEQHSTVMPWHVSTILNFFVLILMIAVLSVAIYLLLILPRIILFDVYDASGGRHRIRRGYRWQWDGKIIPLMTLFTTSGKFKTVLFKQDAKIVGNKVLKSNDAGRTVLIVSRNDIRLSSPSIFFNSREGNLEDIYSYQLAEDYPTLLRECYHRSREFTLYKGIRYGNTLLKSYCTVALWLRRKIMRPVFYNVVTTDDSIVSIESPVLPGTMFLLENSIVDKENNSCVENKGEMELQSLLHDFYARIGKTVNVHDAKILLFMSEKGKSHVWDVVRTEQIRHSKVSLRNVEWLFHYVVNGGNIAAERKMMAKYIHRILHCKPLFVHFNGKQKQQEVMELFVINRSSCLSFLSLVSTEEQPVVTPIYNPFLDGQNNSRQFMVKTDKKNKRSTNHLYSSFLPIGRLPKDSENYMSNLSSDLISFIGNDQVSEIVIEEEHVFIIGGKRCVAEHL